MILTGDKIIKEVKNGEIYISPFDTNAVNPNSYNYRIGDTIKRFDRIENDTPVFKEEIIDDGGYIMNPHQIYLSSTFETIGSKKYMISLIGRSSLGRLGLFLQLSANVGHTGTCHKRTLELVSTKPFILYPRMKIGQVSFWVNDGNITQYQGLYRQFNLPQESLLYTQN